MRTLAELVNTKEPALPTIRGWLAEAQHPVELLGCARAAGERALLALQVTTRSPMGALVHESGGLLVDDGWLRVLGAGCARLPRALDTWNRAPAGPPRLPGALLVGDDAGGGFFAIDGGAFGGEAGDICYFAPDTLRWESTGFGYSDWLYWCCCGDLDGFYEGARWPGWREEVRGLGGDQAFTIYPPMWAEEGGAIGERHRGVVPIEEVWGFQQDLARQLAGDGADEDAAE